MTDLRQDVESLRNSHFLEEYQVYVSGGAHLPVIQNERMRNFIHSLKPLGSWLGLTDQAKNGTWLTWDGKEAPYLHWDKGEPNNKGPPGWKEDCAVLERQNAMNDVPCSRDKSSEFVCQIEGNWRQSL